MVGPRWAATETVEEFTNDDLVFADSELEHMLGPWMERGPEFDPYEQGFATLVRGWINASDNDPAVKAAMHAIYEAAQDMRCEPGLEALATRVAGFELDHLRDFKQKTGNIAHDLINIQTALRTRFAQIMESAGADESGENMLISREDFERMRRIERTIGIFADIISRVAKEGDEKLNLTPENVTQMLEDIVYVMSGSSRTQIILRNVEQIEGKIDAVSFWRIVHNLIKNAQDALRDIDGEGRIFIDAKRNGDMLELTVEDNGPGIPDLIQENLFERGVSTKGGEGRGIGLYNVAKLVGIHGGEIRCESEEDEGSKFELSIRMRGKAVDTAPSNAEILKGKTVVIIDDDAVVCGVMKSFAELFGASAILMAHTKKMWESKIKPKLAANDNLVFILDQNLPDGLGTEIAADIRAAFPEALIILSSGSDEDLSCEGVIDVVMQKLGGRSLVASLRDAFTAKSA